MRLSRSLVVPLAVILLATSAVLVAVQRTTGDAGRQRPLEGFACNPNQLTSYTGIVTRYTRQADSTTLQIKTDWGTTESVTVRHPGTDDPSRFFRYMGKPFAPGDWARVERSKGVLIEGTRATAWVCADGQVAVDWGVPGEVR